ncbi:MAG TPA: NADPH-dependent FMN reductase [Roseiflexaceae bacterium]|nr:NADPH-dependent FMN reductase [Roseiflexaceae bacterium]HMP43158.1 NADPH-dependent FMN reductase [Roseiflexaceae bacterium]
MADRRNGGAIRILGIGGSMRSNSRSRAALQAALAMAHESGATTTLADVRELNLPVFNPELPLDAYPPSLAWLLDEVRAADGILFCSPTYHGTITGAVKNVLDALDFLVDDTPSYLTGKVAGLMAVGGGAANVLNALYHAVRAFDAIIVPTIVALPQNAFDEQSTVLNPSIQRRLNRMVTQVVDLSMKIRPS